MHTYMHTHIHSHTYKHTHKHTYIQTFEKDGKHGLTGDFGISGFFTDAHGRVDVLGVKVGVSVHVCMYIYVFV